MQTKNGRENTLNRMGPARLIDWLTDWLTNWLTDWLTDWLTHSLTHSLIIGKYINLMFKKKKRDSQLTNEMSIIIFFYFL